MVQWFNRRFNTRPDGTRDEAGIAMVLAITVVMLMTLIPVAIYTQAVQQLPLARHDQDHEMALAAAEAGVDDYLNRLAQNQNYWTYNPTNLPPDGNQAFSAWVNVPGPNNSGEQFRYNVNTTQTASAGLVYLTSSGRSRNVVRSVKVGLRRQGFLDYLWLTDYEITDPTLSGASASDCKWHAWEWNTVDSIYGPSTPGSCSVVYWTTQALLNGPVHSNDGLYMCGNPTIDGNADTYYNSPTTNNAFHSAQFGGPGTVLNPLSCTNSPSYSRTGDPAAGTILPFPPANTTLKNQADGTLGGTGCLYTGNTTITLKNVSGVGKMDVVSGKTRSTNTGCGPGNNLNLPANGVIYVQNVPSLATDPNFGTCSGTTCNGDISLSGTLVGQLTIAAANDILITGNTVYHQYPNGTDVLGLAANNNIAVYHPVSSGSNATGFITDPTVDAAILALNHSFYVQNWATGASMGTLTINGVIAQKYRGPVGTFSSGPPPTQVSGYSKNYNYDTRLKYLSPPFFLSPTSSSWGRISYSEIVPTSSP